MSQRDRLFHLEINSDLIYNSFNMSSAQHETLLAIPPQEGLPQLAPTALNLMPFHLDYTGPAQVSTYFQPRSIPGPSRSEASAETAENESITVAAFRGRRVQAHTLDLPLGYTGLVLTAPPLPNRTNPSVPQISSNTNPVKNLKREASPSIGAGSGLRRSPRKRTVDVLDTPVPPARRVRPKRVMQKFSMDSDSDENEDADEGEGAGDEAGKKDDEGVVMQETIEVKETVIDGDEVVLENSKTTTTTTTTTTMTLQQEDTASALPSPTADFQTDLSLDLDLDILQPAPTPIFSRTLYPSASFSSLTIWNPDGPLDQGKDEYCRALGEWMRLGEVLHRD